MSTKIVLTVSSVTENCIAGEQLLVKTTLTNTSDTPLVLSDIYANSPFIYEMKSNTETRLVSQQASKSRTLGLDGEPTEIVITPTEVQPGASIDITEDLTEYALPHFLADTYELKVTAIIQENTVVSAPISITIEKVNPVDIVSTISPLTLTISSFLVHTSSKGNAVLFY